jgi:hypothetical protein
MGTGAVPKDEDERISSVESVDDRASPLGLATVAYLFDGEKRGG